MIRETAALGLREEKAQSESQEDSSAVLLEHCGGAADQLHRVSRVRKQEQFQ